MRFLSHISEDELSGKRVLLRADFNIPIDDGKIVDDTRIQKTLPTIQRILNSGASVAICSHLGRPGGKPNIKYSLRPVAERLSELLGKSVLFFPNPLENKNMKPGDVVLLQNTRFFPEEGDNSILFAAALARGCDLFVNDAFGTAHREHASNVGVSGLLPNAGGLLLEKEITVLSDVMRTPERPLTLILGGAKMKTKIGVLKTFVEKADALLVGGGIANTFLAAQGKNIGDSLFEATEIETAKAILEEAEKHSCHLLLPEDAVVSKEISETASTRVIPIYDISSDERILDIGKKTRAQYVENISRSKMIVWNGPVGLFETHPFSAGTRVISEACAEAKGKTILGGGDTLEAIDRFGYSEENFFHLSTGGGAMLKFLEGKELPGIHVLS
jgi:phosphoglycerate kinase